MTVDITALGPVVALAVPVVGMGVWAVSAIAAKASKPLNDSVIQLTEATLNNTKAINEQKEEGRQAAAEMRGAVKDLHSIASNHETRIVVLEQPKRPPNSAAKGRRGRAA